MKIYYVYSLYGISMYENNTFNGKIQKAAPDCLIPYPANLSSHKNNIRT